MKIIFRYRYYFFIAVLFISFTCVSDFLSAQTGDEQDIMSNLYQQQAAEYRALCLQDYNIATRMLEVALKTKTKKSLPLAIITDLDETALDNSAYEVHQYLLHRTYDGASWATWCDSAIAGSVPGSVSFFNWADSKKVIIFYVSNRMDSLRNATMRNMKKLGFPQIDTSRFLFKTNTNSKEARRQKIEKKYQVVLLLGDNLADLDAAFDSATAENRLKSVDLLKKQWGSRYIVFPNAVYGDWETILYRDYENEHHVRYPSMQAIDSIRISKLKGY